MVFVFVHNLPLRPPSRVAGDYFSGSVVCFVVLRPSRPLREIKIRVFFSHRIHGIHRFPFLEIFFWCEEIASRIHRIVARD